MRIVPDGPIQRGVGYLDVHWDFVGSPLADATEPLRVGERIPLSAEYADRWHGYLLDAFGLLAPGLPEEKDGTPYWFFFGVEEEPRVMKVWRMRAFPNGSPAHAEALWLPETPRRLAIRGIEGVSRKERANAVAAAERGLDLLQAIDASVRGVGRPSGVGTGLTREATREEAITVQRLRSDGYEWSQIVARTGLRERTARRRLLDLEAGKWRDLDS